MRISKLYTVDFVVSTIGINMLDSPTNCVSLNSARQRPPKSAPRPGELSR